MVQQLKCSLSPINVGFPGAPTMSQEASAQQFEAPLVPDVLMSQAATSELAFSPPLEHQQQLQSPPSSERRSPSVQACAKAEEPEERPSLSVQALARAQEPKQEKTSQDDPSLSAQFPPSLQAKTTVIQQLPFKQQHLHRCKNEAQRFSSKDTALGQQLLQISPSKVNACPSTQAREEKLHERTASRQIKNLTSPRAPQQIYPAALATHDAVVADDKLFRDTLQAFHVAFGIKPTTPKIDGKDLDLHLLYKEVTSRGGIEMVIKDRKWKEINGVFDFPHTTSTSFVLRKSYISLLHHYELVYFFGIKGQIVPPPAAVSSSSPVVSQVVDIDMNLEISNEVEFGLKRAKGIIDSAQALGVDPASSIGAIVTGAIDGKFDHGYLVTVMVGTRKMRGVLYHVPTTSTVQQKAIIPALLSNVGSELKPSDLGARVARRTKRKDVSRKDPNAPRQNRTGYNFFFAEQRKKLKALQPDKDRAISKMIGELWNRLSEDEKSPYQERGLKDKERYKSEMMEYKESLKLRLTNLGSSNGGGAIIQHSGKHGVWKGDTGHQPHEISNANEDENHSRTSQQQVIHSDICVGTMSSAPGYHLHTKVHTLPRYEQGAYG